MINALCIDLEHWWCNEFLTKYLPDDKEDQIVQSLTPIMDLLDKYEVKASVFILGSVAEEHPDVVREIHQKGHEIGSHAYSHKTLHQLNEYECEKEIVESNELLESITGEKIIGFRAPSFSLDNRTKWALPVLFPYPSYSSP